MTRQWLADPQYMCRQHLLGEHLEAHIFVSKMEKDYSLEGFIRGSMFFGAEYVKYRHDIIARYLSRFSNKEHKTPLWIGDFEKINYPLKKPNEKDFSKSNDDLYGRCQKCRDIRMGQEWQPI